MLDAGCGTGYTLERLGDRYDLTGMDLSLDAIEIARQHTGALLVQGDLLDAPIPGPSFDGILALDIIEHIDDDLASVIALRDLLDPGGVMIITVPAGPSLWSEHDVALGHKRRYTRGSLADLLEQADLQIEKLTCYNSLLHPPIAAWRRLRPTRTKEAEAASSDLRPINPVLNGVLKWLLASERHLLRHLDLPFGLSLLAIVRHRRSEK